MSISTQYHELLNSVKYQMIRNNDYELNYIREQFKVYCDMKNYVGALLNGYNKMFQLNELGLRDYFNNQLPQKYFVEFFSQYI